jgi:hypothetical protein
VIQILAMEMVTVLMLETPFLVAVGMGGPVICVNKISMNVTRMFARMGVNV